MDPLTIMGLLGLGSAIIGGVSSAFNNERNIGFQEQINQDNIRMQKEINERNWAEQWKMWNATNEYNDPAAQMARFEKAGLNPNLIYGQQQTTSAVNVATGDAPKSQAPVSDISGIQKALDDLLKLPMLKEQYKEQRENARRAQYEADIAQVKSEYDWQAYQLWQKQNAGLINMFNDFDSFNKYAEKVTKNAFLALEAEQGEYQYKKALPKVQEAMYKIKQVESENVTEWWDLRLRALEIANDLKGIELDWAEFDKITENATGWLKTLFQFIRMFLK